jgi:hypothetical protein
MYIEYGIVAIPMGGFFVFFVVMGKCGLRGREILSFVEGMGEGMIFGPS